MLNKHIRVNISKVKLMFSVLTLAICMALLTGVPNPAQASSHISKTGSVEQYKEIARVMVNSVAKGLGGALANIKSEKERIELIRSFIAPIRFYPDNSGYFYVYDYKCVNIAHAIQKDLQGKNLYDYKDVKGKYVIRALSEAAKKGGGYVDFYWVKPGSQEQSAKLGYVEPIPGTDYFIGTGVYLP